MNKIKLTGAVLAISAAAAFSVANADMMKMGHHKNMVKCMGVNACKGKSSCKGAHSSCKGKNSCKGKGAVAMTKEQCEQVGGKAE